MKEQDLKDIWRSLENYPGVRMGGAFDAERFVRSRSITIKYKIRKMLQNDLILKIVGSLVTLLDIAFYVNNLQVLYVCVALLIFYAITSAMEYISLKQFNRIADPAQSTRDNLSEVLIFLQRKSNIMGMLKAASQVMIFVPGLLGYFYLTYGYLKPITNLSFFVFSTLCAIGMVAAYLMNNSQVKYYMKHITICISDLNDNILQAAYASIEKDRRHDNVIKMTVTMLIIFAFVAFLAVLKSIMGA